MKHNIKLLFLDVDGTLTDGKIYMGQNGEMMKAFDIKDGCGIHDIAIPNGIIPIICTGRKSDIVLNRCKELGIDQVYQGISNKAKKIIELGSGVLPEYIAYMGDDINDLECMQLIKQHGGMVGCPADAVQKVKNIANFIAPHEGGHGAVRDFIEWLVG